MTQPTKEQIRQWQQARIKSHEPPPDPMRIRQELGWGLMEPQDLRQKKQSALR
jgi:hypothetical protein